MRPIAPAYKYTLLLVVALVVATEIALAQNTGLTGSEDVEATNTVNTDDGNTIPTPFPNQSRPPPAHLPVPGGIAVVPLGIFANTKPIAKFGSRELLVVPWQDQWHAIVGLHGSLLPGNYIVATVDGEDEPGTAGMSINMLPPPSVTTISAAQTLAKRLASPVTLSEDLATSNYVNPDIKIPVDILNFKSELEPSFSLSPVLESDRLIPYGKIRKATSIVTHDYISYLSGLGKQIYAPARSIVIRIIEKSDGKALLFMDHGGGIISVMGNLQKVLVQEGQELDRGEQIGRAGRDGALDQSRLDFGVSLNGYLVDPLQFSSAP